MFKLKCKQPLPPSIGPMAAITIIRRPRRRPPKQAPIQSVSSVVLFMIIITTSIKCTLAEETVERHTTELDDNELSSSSSFVRSKRPGEDVGPQLSGPGRQEVWQPVMSSNSNSIPAANPNFEAAFQGECGQQSSSSRNPLAQSKTWTATGQQQQQQQQQQQRNPCEHICLDLHDGTYECACFYGFTLAVDGYSCTSGSSSISSSSSSSTGGRLQALSGLTGPREPGGASEAAASNADSRSEVPAAGPKVASSSGSGSSEREVSAEATAAAAQVALARPRGAPNGGGPSLDPGNDNQGPRAGDIRAATNETAISRQHGQPFSEMVNEIISKRPDRDNGRQQQHQHQRAAPGGNEDDHHQDDNHRARGKTRGGPTQLAAAAAAAAALGHVSRGAQSKEHREKQQQQPGFGGQQPGMELKRRQKQLDRQRTSYNLVAGGPPGDTGRIPVDDDPGDDAARNDVVPIELEDVDPDVRSIMLANDNLVDSFEQELADEASSAGRTRGKSGQPALELKKIRRKLDVGASSPRETSFVDGPTGAPTTNRRRELARDLGLLNRLVGETIGDYHHHQQQQQANKPLHLLEATAAARSGGPRNGERSSESTGRLASYGTSTSDGDTPDGDEDDDDDDNREEDGAETEEDRDIVELTNDGRAIGPSDGQQDLIGCEEDDQDDDANQVDGVGQQQQRQSIALVDDLDYNRAENTTGLEGNSSRNQLAGAGGDRDQPGRRPHRGRRRSRKLSRARAELTPPGSCLEMPMECESGGECFEEIRPHRGGRSSGRREARCRCPIGRGGTYCQRPAQRRIPSFSGESYLALPMVTDYHMTSLRLQFRPTSSHSNQNKSADQHISSAASSSSLLLYSNRFVLLLDEMQRIELRYLQQSSRAASQPLMDNTIWGDGQRPPGEQTVTRVIGSRDAQLNQWNELIITDASSDQTLDIREEPAGDDDDSGLMSNELPDPSPRVESSIKPSSEPNKIILVTPYKIQLGGVVTSLLDATRQKQHEMAQTMSVRNHMELMAGAKRRHKPDAGQLFVGGIPESVLHREIWGERNIIDASDTARTTNSLRNVKDESRARSLLDEARLNSLVGFKGCVRELQLNERIYNFKSDLNGDALDGFDVGECTLDQ